MSSPRPGRVRLALNKLRVRLQLLAHIRRHPAISWRASGVTRLAASSEKISPFQASEAGEVGAGFTESGVGLREACSGVCAVLRRSIDGEQGEFRLESEMPEVSRMRELA